MPSTYTTRSRLEKQAAGENNNTWGIRLNDNVIDLTDFGMDGIVAFTLSGTKTLTTANGAPDEARARILNITGGSGGTVEIPDVEKLYLVCNASSGPVTITTGTGTDATVVAGDMQWVFSEGGNVVRATSWMGALTALTLENKTIDLADNTLTGTLAEFNTACSDADFASIAGAETFTNKTLTTPTINGGTIGSAPADTVYSISDGAAFAVDPANGAIQKVTLGASRTPTLTAITSGKLVVLQIDDGSAYSITWTSVTWLSNGGVAPVLKTTGYTTVILVHNGVGLQGVVVGDAG